MTKAVDMLETNRQQIEVCNKQIEDIVENNKDLLPSDYRVEIDIAQAGVRIYLNSTKNLTVHQYQELRNTFPMKKYLHNFNALLEFLPDTRPNA